jgi:hypothetical protein
MPRCTHLRNRATNNDASDTRHNAGEPICRSELDQTRYMIRLFMVEDRAANHCDFGEAAEYMVGIPSILTMDVKGDGLFLGPGIPFPEEK